MTGECQNMGKGGWKVQKAQDEPSLNCPLQYVYP
jgi:hypothetical protein